MTLLLVLMLCCSVLGFFILGHYIYQFSDIVENSIIILSNNIKDAYWITLFSTSVSYALMLLLHFWS